ncbi:enteropeptidase [Trichonephila clavipes]|nr:enteropeptidase [Trichonephila clavipes]
MKLEAVIYIMELDDIFVSSNSNNFWLLLNQKENDIALIHLNAPVSMTSHVRPICLPPWQIKLSQGTVCHVTGWGETLGRLTEICLAYVRLFSRFNSQDSLLINENARTYSTVEMPKTLES